MLNPCTTKVQLEKRRREKARDMNLRKLHGSDQFLASHPFTTISELARSWRRRKEVNSKEIELVSGLAERICSNMGVEATNTELREHDSQVAELEQDKQPICSETCTGYGSCTLSRKLMETKVHSDTESTYNNTITERH